jgi:hypothetical protein
VVEGEVLIGGLARQHDSLPVLCDAHALQCMCAQARGGERSQGSDENACDFLHAISASAELA